jgi:hypothetical protein
MATVVAGMVTLSLFSAYSGIEFQNTTLLEEAQYYSEGLHIEIGDGDPIPVIVKDYNYNGTLYVTDFKINTSLLDSSSLLTPTGGNTQATVYTTSGNILYQGKITIQEIQQDQPYFVENDSILWIMVNLQGQYYRIGYEVIG